MKSGACGKLTNRWLLDGSALSTSGNTVFDSIGSWHGQAYGGYKYGNETIIFDGTGYINLGSHTFGGAMSFAFWGKFEVAVQWQNFFDVGSGAVNENIFFAPAYPDQTGIFFTVYDSHTWFTSNQVPSYTASVGVWNHYVVTLSSQGMWAVYVNGVSVAFGSTNVAETVTRQFTYIGRSCWLNPSWWQGTGTGFLNGAIKDFQFALGTAFTASEAAYLYANVCPAGSSETSRITTSCHCSH